MADSIDTESTVGVPRSDARSDVPSDPVELPWPDPVRWAEQLSASAAVATHPVHDTAAPDMAAGEVIRPLVFDGTRVYLQRYWLHERTVGDALLHGMQTTSRFTPGAPDDRGAIEAVLDRYFGPAVTTAASGDTGTGTGDTGAGTDLQREAAETALSRKVAIIAGGPGTGKTHTVARLLAAMHHLALDSGRTLEVALTAPTGKAAARMTQAVHEAVRAPRRTRVCTFRPRSPQPSSPPRPGQSTACWVATAASRSATTVTTRSPTTWS
ncbi:MAG: AAA family ATPase [Microthrixaceae bacterium]|nr:AAA family ATPase [Microthrixaceae bacterium]